MKPFYLLYFLLLSYMLIAQNTPTVAIKIYLEDAETGKNIADAKVTLEGYEIPAITAKYDKKNKYYYFNEIPRGYNTIMAYHKKYNEKGFQNIEGLPKELKLKLQDYRFVSYFFDEPKLEQIRNNYLIESDYLKNLQEIIKKDGTVKNENFRYLYNEDPYHIAIITKYSIKDFFSNDTIKNLMNKLLLERTIYKKGSWLQGKEVYFLTYYNFQFTGGFEKYEYAEDDVENIESTKTIYFNDGIYNVLFFHKKDKTKFKRYNCNEIQELRRQNLRVAVLTSRVIEYFANSKFKKEEFSEYFKHYGVFSQDSIDNYNFGKFRNPVQLFFKNYKKEHKMYYGKKGFRKFYDETYYPSIETLFFLIPNDFNSNIGLGALDYDNENKINFSEKFYFFNALSNKNNLEINKKSNHEKSIY